jgi:hypothetical protein
MRVLEKRVLRKMYGLKTEELTREWKKCLEMLIDLHSLPIITTTTATTTTTTTTTAVTNTTTTTIIIFITTTSSSKLTRCVGHKCIGRNANTTFKKLRNNHN